MSGKAHAAKELAKAARRAAAGGGKLGGSTSTMTKALGAGLKAKSVKLLLGGLLAKPLVLGAAVPAGIISWYGLGCSWDAAKCAMLYGRGYYSDDGKNPFTSTTSLVAGRCASLAAMGAALPSAVPANSYFILARRVAARGVGASIIGGGIQAAVLLS
jgi:hypothetical protein